MTIREIHICIPFADDKNAAMRTVRNVQDIVDPCLLGLGAAFQTVGLGTFHQGSVTRVPDTPFAEIVLEAGKAMGHVPVLTIIYAVNDFEAAEQAIAQATKDTSLSGMFETARWLDETSDEDFGAPWKSIEIYYDIASVPEKYEHPLDFRNEAMELIEIELEKAGVGEWSGAEFGMGEVNFGFEVSDFDKAEAIVRQAVAGTPFDCIREITRFDSETDMPAPALMS